MFGGRPYEDGAKLIARCNFDWLNNPESHDVPYHYMWEGSKFVIPVIMECDPDLIIPMDEKSFGVLQIAFYEYGYNITPPKIGEISIKIFEKKWQSEISP